MPSNDPLKTLRSRVSTAVEPYISKYHPRPYRETKIVRDVIWGMVNILPHELALVDSPLFQRLRRVKQTSLAQFTYPCAGHSRFEHSLGCLAAADRVLNALQRRIQITEKDRFLIRLAALLHDCTHGPFSHTSEAFYKSDPIFDAIRTAKPELYELFRRANASEILTYCFITSKPFRHVWEEMLNQYERSGHYRLGGLLSENDRWQIATMIVGADFNPERPEASPGLERRYLRQLINGPFDVDKLDYIARDGYFTGLSLAIDVERLLWILDTILLEADQNGRRARAICVSASGATVLEQILFSKMQLYSSVYHHHKVRVSHQALLRLFTCLKQAGVRIRGLSLDDPATYMCLDDADILHACEYVPHARRESQPLKEARLLTREILERNLPRRALVLTHPVWGKDPQRPSDRDRKTWEAKMKASDQPGRFARQVARAAGEKVTDIWVDIPGSAPLQGTAQEGFVKFDDRTYLAIVEIFPIGGWLSGYDAYRSISYVFSRENRERVGRIAREVLANEYGVKTNDVSLKLARTDLDGRLHPDNKNALKTARRRGPRQV